MTHWPKLCTAALTFALASAATATGAAWAAALLALLIPLAGLLLKMSGQLGRVEQKVDDHLEHHERPVWTHGERQRRTGHR